MPDCLSLRTAAHLAWISALGLAGCASKPQATAVEPLTFLERLTPYRVDIRQGNVVTREQLGQVRTGMPREQVRDILGSPMLTDIFHAQRWDYLFASARRTGSPTAPSRLSVAILFDAQGLVEKIVAPSLPTEHEFVAGMVDPKAAKAKVPPLELTAEQKAKLPPPVRSESPALALPQGPARTYPPLEPR